MALNFPASPANGQVYFDSTSLNRYVYNSTLGAWKYAANNDPFAVTGNKEIIFNNNGTIDGDAGLVYDLANGRLGVGTSNPAYTLDVAGDTRITGNLTLGDATTDTVTVNATNFSLANNVSFDSGTLYIDKTNDRVGIGTTSPSYKLVVSNGGANGYEIAPNYSAGAETRLISYNRSTLAYTGVAYDALMHYWMASGGEKMRLDASGNLGLGVVPSAWGSGWTALQIKSGGASIWTDGGQRSFFSSNMYFDGTNRKYLTNGFAHQYVMDSDGSYSWYKTTSGAAGGTISFTQAMILNANGNVSINTANNDHLLNLESPYQQFKISGLAARIRMNRPGNGSGTTAFDFQANNQWEWAFGTLSNLTTDLTYRANTGTGYLDVITMSNTGKVGIGTTSPLSQLHVANTGDAKLTLTSTVAGGGFVHMWATDHSSASYQNITSYNTDGTAHWGIGGFGAANSFIIKTQSNERMRIDPAGNIIIGATSSSYKLDVVGKVRLGYNTTQGTPNSSDLTANAHTLLSGTGGNYLAIGQYGSTGSYAQWIQSSYITPTTAIYDLVLQPLGGNVGIGTSSPGTKLNIYSNSASHTFVRSQNTVAYADFGPLSDGTVYGPYAAPAASTGLVIGTSNSNPVKFYANGSESVRIDPAGNVCIGGTSSSYKLQVVTGQGTDGITVYSGGRALTMRANSGPGYSNPMFQAGDTGLVYTAGTVNTGTFTIAPWSDYSRGMRLDANGSIAIGTTSTAGGYNGTLYLSGNGQPYDGYLEGIHNGQVVPSTVTTRFDAFVSSPITTAASFTLPSLNHFIALSTTIGAGSSVTTQRGFWVTNQITGGTYNYAFQGDIPSGTGRYNVYMSGTANNYFAGNVGVGTNAPQYNLHVNGSFAANTKSFVIDHPTKPGMKLRYGSLEGPENGVYVRGRLTNQHHIQFPDYWKDLVDIDTVTVQLTPIGKTEQPSVGDITDYGVNVLGNTIDCFYFIQAERKDVEKLIVEFEA